MQQKCRPSLDADERRSFDVDVNSLSAIDVLHPLPRLRFDRLCNGAVRPPITSWRTSLCMAQRSYFWRNMTTYVTYKVLFVRHASRCVFLFRVSAKISWA